MGKDALSIAGHGQSTLRITGRPTGGPWSLKAVFRWRSVL
jgi:hypothetical protein